MAFLTALFMSVSATAAIDALNFASPEQEKDYHQINARASLSSMSK